MGLWCHPPGCPEWRIGAQRCVARSWLLGFCWTPVCIFCACRRGYSAMFAGGNTHQVYTSKEERAAAFCDNRLLRCGVVLKPLCVTELWASSTGPCRSLSCRCWAGWALARKVNNRLWPSQEVSQGSLVWAGMLKPVLTISPLDGWQKSKWNYEAGKTLLSSLEWNPIVTSSGKTGAELKNPKSYFSACVHIMSMIDACVVLNRQFISVFWFSCEGNKCFLA